MPELPEVETVVKGLKNYCLNKTIKNVCVYYGKQIHGDINRINNRKITDIKRRGKNIIFCFDSNIFMIMTLLM